MSEDVWSYALELYACPGVEAACLGLQEEGADVCLLLTAAWLGTRGIAFRTDRLEVLNALAEPWRTTVIAPLRSLRQQWRTQAQHDPQLQVIRERLKKLELDAERSLLERLSHVAQEWPEERAQDLQRWLQEVAGKAGGERRDALEQLRIAASRL